jgi:hypothetical protein
MNARPKLLKVIGGIGLVMLAAEDAYLARIMEQTGLKKSP